MSQRPWYSRTSTVMGKAELARYAETRRELYPNTYQDEHPSDQAKADYEDYKSRQYDAKKAARDYDAAYSREPGATYNMETGEPDLDELSTDQHKRLVYPAAKAEMDSADHAHARDRFLVNHPYGYRNQNQRGFHDQYVDDAYEQANGYRRCYDTHSRQSGGNPSALKKGRPAGGYSVDSHHSHDSYVADDDDDDNSGKDDNLRLGKCQSHGDSSDDGGEPPDSFRAPVFSGSRNHQHSHRKASGSG